MKGSGIIIRRSVHQSPSAVSDRLSLVTTSSNILYLYTLLCVRVRVRACVLLVRLV